MKSIFCLLFSFYVSQLVIAQHILNAESPSEIGINEMTHSKDSTSIYYDAPLPYGKIDPRDILWSRVVWETIDLNERMNFPLYFPIDTLNADRGKKSLFDVLLNGIEKGEITEVYQDTYFRQKLTLKELRENMEKIDTLDLGIEQANAGEEISQEYIDKVSISSVDIVMYKIRSMWYFDSRLGELRYRLLGIAPVAADVYQSSSEVTDADLVELFWVWYPGAREFLHRHKISSTENYSINFSFDDLLNARKFHSLIYKVHNQYSDRPIRDYFADKATMQIMEAMRLKNLILDFENDQWVY